MPDHVHLVVSIPPTLLISDSIGKLGNDDALENRSGEAQMFTAVTLGERTTHG